MDAIIGVIGTLLGTILGWVLNSFSKKGKVHIYVSSWNDEFRCQDEIGQFIYSYSKEDSQYYAYSVVLDLYNSSEETRILRNVEIVFNDGHNDLHCSVPKDDETRHGNGPLILYDDILPINIPPKTVIQIKLHDGDWNKNGEMDYIWKSKSVFLKYCDEKEKQYKILIHSEDYSRFFETHKSEDN